MRTYIVISLLLIVSGIFYAWNVPTTPPTEPAKIHEKQPALTLSSEEVAQGEILIVETQGPITKLQLQEKEMTLVELNPQTNDRKVAVLGFDTRAEIGPRTLHYETPQGTKTKTFQVVKRDYPVTHIVVPEKLAQEGVTSGDLAESIAANDNVTLTDIISIETDQYHINNPFVEPTGKWIDVGGFGNVREDQYGSIRHLGVDLEGEPGDPVYATNRGVVVFAGELQNYGNSIIIDHGVGIFSIYLHLSTIETNTNTYVDVGEHIGRIGNTGAYTLEPHLHFSIKVHGISVDPRAFIDTFNRVL